MYCPAHFAESSHETMHALMRAHPLATLVTLGKEGLCADHLPLTLELPDSGPALLRGHIARANPTWKTASADVEALAIFRGPDAYISPNWYPTKHEHGKAVPTWNYITVHARGPLRLIESPDWLRQHVEELTRQQERAFATPWAVTDAPADYIDQMLRAIVGVEMAITSLEGKWKVSQNQPQGNRAGAACGLRELDSADAAAMADLIERA